MHPKLREAVELVNMKSINLLFKKVAEFVSNLALGKALVGEIG